MIAAGKYQHVLDHSATNKSKMTRVLGQFEELKQLLGE